MNLDLPCAHEDVHIHLNMVYMEDSGRRQAELRLWCKDCNEPFLWADSIMIGVDLNGVARSVDGQELRIAITSAADLPEGLI